jgi:hypothetical protein
MITKQFKYWISVTKNYDFKIFKTSNEAKYSIIINVVFFQTYHFPFTNDPHNSKDENKALF